MFNNAMLLAGVAAEPVGLIRVTSDLKVRLGGFSEAVKRLGAFGRGLDGYFRGRASC